MSDVDICNDALALIGKAAINSLLDPEPAARQSQRFYRRTLKEMQAMFTWDFNLYVRDISNTEAAAIMPGFEYAHKLPTDYLRMSGVTSVADSTGSVLDSSFNAVSSWDTQSAAQLRIDARTQNQVAFKVANGYVHTNFTPIRLVYHRYITDVEKLTSVFRTALVAQLATKLVFPLTRDRKLTEDIRQLAADAIAQAKDDEDTDDANEMPTGSTFEDARG